MFGRRTAPTPTSVEWPNLLALLEDDDRRAAVCEKFPDNVTESFLSALRRIDPQAANDVISSGRQLHTAQQLINYPTIAVAGMLNSGKTSLVATFLSEHGRKRTLRGTNNNQGTHRFVLWLPAAWHQDAELWGVLMSRLSDSLGKAPEMLDEDPTIAHAQYNNRQGDEETLAIPLVATDPALDDIGVALLDCPDIVSDAQFGLGSPAARRELLSRASVLCSAFLVVSSAESSRDATLGDILRIATELMPGVPRLLAVNKVRPRQSPEQVLETFTTLARNHGVEAVYVAYDFDVPGSRPFIPALDEVTFASQDPEDPLPVFFLVNRDPDQNPPASISSDRLLYGLPKQLDRAQLYDKFRLALEQGLRLAVWDQGFAKIVADVERNDELTKRSQQFLLSVSLEFFAHRSLSGEIVELRLLHSRRVIAQLAEAFAENAPWYARISVRVSTKWSQFIGGAKDLMTQLIPTSLAKKTAEDVKGKLNRGEYGTILSPDRLQAAIQRMGGIGSLTHWKDESRLDPACEEAIMRFERSDVSTLDHRRLQAAVQQMWREVPVRKKLVVGLTPLATMLAAFGGALMIPIDFGTSWFAAASISEILAAMGLTAFATMWAGNKSTQTVGQQAAKQQLANFHAILCDTFGIARPQEPPSIEVGRESIQLVGIKLPNFESVVDPLRIYDIREEFRQELRRAVPRGPAGAN